MRENAWTPHRKSCRGPRTEPRNTISACRKVCPEATKANYDKYQEASKAFRTARAQRDRISDEQTRRQPTQQTEHGKTFVNSFGEATKREITNQTYTRAQKRISRAVLRNMGH